MWLFSTTTYLLCHTSPKLSKKTKTIAQLHDRTDEECLELATSIRVVLTEFAERVANALKDEAELNTAVARLLKANAPQQ
jgi:hypothetical protein